MTLFAYVMTDDDGFAPNPFHGVCTLARCMPVTRSVAQVGDYVVGLAGESLRKGGDWRIIYAMQVTDKMTFDEYWNDSRFLAKRPDKSAGGKEAMGDNDIDLDTGGKYALISDAERFTYWGSKTCPIPEPLGFLVSVFHRETRGNKPNFRGHRRKFSEEEVQAFVEWFAEQEKGRLGEPTDSAA